MDVSVIIVNYNTQKQLDDCLFSIKQKTHGICYEVIVVDNASGDDSVAMVGRKYPWVKLIESETNLGFGKANNLGFKYATGRNIFLLNSDTILIENSVKTLCEALDRDNSIGAVGAILIGKDRRQKHSFGKFPTLKSKFLGNDFVIKGADFKECRDVDYITGADLMLPRSLMVKLGGFDPELFLYYEETDLQKRMATLGYRRVILPNTKIIHLEGESSKNTSSSENTKGWKNIIMFKSMVYYLKKHSNPLGFKILTMGLLIKYSFLKARNENKADYYQQIINCLKL